MRELIAAVSLAALLGIASAPAVPVAGTHMLAGQFVPIVDVATEADGAKFTNMDGRPHQAAAPVGCDTDCVWATPVLGFGDSAVIGIPAGTYQYYCTIHPQMRGILAVV